jgi:capsular polysaccharide transport system ATP-binding protein
MIEITNLRKVYPVRGGEHIVLNNLNFTIRRGEKIGVLGRNGAGKSTLIRILSGAEQPSEGSIKRNMSLSWPLAFGGAFQSSLTGLDNLKFICRIYGVSYKEKIGYVQDFSELGKFLREPVKTYSSGMRARLAFAISMAVDFECFLIDEVISVGDARFHEKCKRELFEKRSDRGFLIVSHEMHNIKEHCDKAFVLHNGSLNEFLDINDAYSWYIKNT